MLGIILIKINGISVRLVWIGGFMLIAAAIMVTVDVFLRKFFNVSMAGSDELSGYAFGVSTTFALSYALLTRSNIRVDAFYHLFPSWFRPIADILGHVLLLGLIGLIAYMGFQMLMDTYHFGSRSITPLRTPLAIPQTLWWLGLAFSLFTGIILLLVSLKALFAGDRKTVQQLIGIKSVDEQIDEETVVGE